MKKIFILKNLRSIVTYFYETWEKDKQMQEFPLFYNASIVVYQKPVPSYYYFDVEDGLLETEWVAELHCDEDVTTLPATLESFLKFARIIYDAPIENWVDETFDEYCPCCDNEVELKGFIMQKCPVCKDKLAPCSLCNLHYRNLCEFCPLK